jgi:hypothetical protein
MEGLERLKSAWEEILANMTHRRFFHLWEWYHSYLKCLAPDPDAILFFLFTKERTPIAIFPLHDTRFAVAGLQLKALSFPSHDHLLLCDLICQDNAFNLPLFQLLRQYLKQQGKSWDVIILRHLLEDACAMRAIHQYPPSRFLLRHEGGCDYTNTESTTYEAYISGLSKNFRRSLKRARQYLDQLPEVRFAFTQDGPDIEARFNAFLDVEASGWKGISGTGSAIKLHPDLVCFYREIIHAFSASGKVLINTLYADGNCMAAQFCLLLDETAYMLKVGYNEEFSRYAPGKLLVGKFIELCMGDSAIQRINYITDAEWHADWAPNTYGKSICYIYNTSPAGLMAYGFMKIYGIHIKPRLPGWLQKRIEPKLDAGHA